MNKYGGSLRALLQVKSSIYFSTNESKKDIQNEDVINQTISQEISTINQEKPINESESSSNSESKSESKKNDDTLNKEFRKGLGRYLLYFMSGLTVAFIYNYIKYREEYSINLPCNLSDKPLPLKAYLFSRVFPNRAISRIAVPLFNKEIPISLRKLIYNFYGLIYTIKWDDFKNDLTEYKTLREFFTRKLEKERIISGNDIVSPVDGRILTFGEIIKDKSNEYILEQIKGVPYKLKQFIGEIPQIKNGNKLYYIIIYLGPGDYHRFHAPNNILVNSINHIVGDLYPVRISWLKMIPGLFSLNERIILKGYWNNNDLYYYIPVGAFNVGSIKIYSDKDIVTNMKLHDKDIWYKNTNKIINKEDNNENDEDLRNALWNVNNKKVSPYYKNQLKQNPYRKQYYQGGLDIPIDKGSEIGHFEFGSTIVMLFESDKFTFKCQPNQKIEFGQPIGDCL